MNVIDAFVVSFALDAKGFKSGAREVDEGTKRLRENSKRSFDEMEKSGERLGETLKGVRNETVSLGLAFLGASSITGLVAQMMTGAAAADRLGQTMGMSTQKVWAWRMAMDSVGGQAGEADSALKTIQNDRMAYRFGQMDGHRGIIYSRLGIGNDDLKNSNPGDILQKLARAQGSMDPQTYASLLQQIGLPASTIAFLQKGQTGVDKLIGQFEKDGKGQEALAKKTEQLQQSLTTLKSAILDRLVPVLIQIADFLNRVVGRHVGSNRDGYAPRAPSEIMGRLNSLPPGAPAIGQIGVHGGGSAGTGNLSGASVTYARAFLSQGFNKTLTAAILANMQHESGFDPNRIGDGGLARGVLQWHPDRQANFKRMFHTDISRATPDQIARFVKWEFDNHIGKRGRNAIMRAAETGDVALAARLFDQFYEVSAGLSRNARGVSAGRYARALSGSTTNNFYIKSTDPKGAAREVASIQRRSHAVASADQGIAP